jgi:C4-dicarboxylate-specific signal transduction histidine kinase
MGIVSHQATHVINSIKTMGISNQNWSKDVDLNKTVTDAIAILRSLTRRVTLTVDLDETIAPIEACHGELVQVWVNLIKNAIESLSQFKVNDPQVRVRTFQTARHVKVSIEDNGVGIPPEIIEKIYEPNFTTKVEGISLGLGLGLTIVQRIVAEHAGSIRLSSAPGKTCFTVNLKKKLNP